MVLFTACGGRDIASEGSTTASGEGNTPTGSQNVQVSLSEYKITSPLTTFTAGTTYHFTVKNDGKIAHEFMVLPPMEHGHMGDMSMEDMHKMALSHIENLNPGETQTIDVTFPASTSGQNLEFSCHLPGHYEAGMKLPVVINK
ncbi:MAG: hypothetical protein IMW89_21840 [Ktedonobacteraceae bacterium]|nr:hypothetical protein [Ktedonobacteraceae bacterium]